MSTAKHSPSVSYAKFSPFYRLLGSYARSVRARPSELVRDNPDAARPRGTMRRFVMLRAALIGFGSSGKTTLFQLMTSAKETPRGARQGRGAIGISKVPDARLDRLTAMYNPRKRVPATVEFSDIAAPDATGGAKALVDVVAYKNADALVHVVRAFQDPAVAASGRLDRSGARRAGDGRRADPRRPRRGRTAAGAAREGSEEEPHRRNSNASAMS